MPTQTSQSNCLGEHLRILDPLAYAYLLGMYLGDGCISHCPRDVASVIHVASGVAGPGEPRHLSKRKTLATN